MDLKNKKQREKEELLTRR